MEEVRYTTQDGQTVVVDELADAHLEAHPSVRTVLEEALAKLTLPAEGDQHDTTVDLGREVGVQTLVAVERVDLDTPTTFALRANRAYPSHVRACAATEPCRSVAVSVARRSEHEWVLLTAYIGVVSPNEPPYGDPALSKEFERSLTYWCAHAIVYDPATMGPMFESTWRKELEKAGVM